MFYFLFLLLLRCLMFVIFFLRMNFFLFCFYGWICILLWVLFWVWFFILWFFMFFFFGKCLGLLFLIRRNGLLWLWFFFLLLLLMRFLSLFWWEWWRVRRVGRFSWRRRLNNGESDGFWCVLVFVDRKNVVINIYNCILLYRSYM